MSCIPTRQWRPTGLGLTMVVATMAWSCSTPPAPQPELPSDPNHVQSVAASGDSHQLLPLNNGLTAYLQVTPRGAGAQVQLGVFAGSLFVAPGLAELAARVMLDSSDPTTGRASLRRRIEALGGSIEVHVGLMATWFDVRARAPDITKAVAAIREALESVTQSRNQIDRMRNELVTERSAEILADPITATARVLMQAERGTADHLNALLDLDSSEVSLFHSRLYRPERCLLAVSAPRRLPITLKQILEPEAQSIASWRPPPAVPGASKVLDRSFESGLYWAETEGRPGRVRVGLVLRLPNPGTVGAAEWLTMHSCLTLDGTGGRLERLQDEAGLSHILWETSIEQSPDFLALVMSAITTPEEATSLWRILNRARQSLIEVPPTPSELQLALRRASLNANLATLTDSSRLRLAANLKTRNIPPNSLALRLRELADPSKWDLTRAAEAYMQTPAWMIVVGAGRPDSLPGLRPFDLLPADFEASAHATPTPKSLAKIAPWLLRARAAIGNEETFARLHGFTATSNIVADQAPDASDIVHWTDTGNLARSRTVLGQTLITKLDGSDWSESLDTTKKSLNAREAKLLRHEMMRHPLMLLAAHAQGTIQFRPIARRKSGDREFMVLEAVGDEFDRLRIHIDTESHLIRIVESWAHLPDDTLVHIRETWSDYRAANSMRAPHLRRTNWNDGVHQTQTVFSEWLPVLSKQ